jgi:class 3 adenylate cyclase
MLGRTLEQKAVWTYRLASIAATVEAFFLFIFGLDLSARQTWLFFIFGMPATFVMYATDRWLIGRYVSPILPALAALEVGRVPELPTAYRAWVQSLNLSTLTLIRVLTVHAPSILLPISLLCGLANLFAGLDLKWWQFVVLWFFWPITAVPHAILEYFLIDRISQPLLMRLDPHVRAHALRSLTPATILETLQMAAGRELAEPRVVRIPTAVQLAGMFLFVSLVPMFALGASVYLKIAVGRLAAVGAWITLLIGINAVVSIAVVALSSMRVHRAMQELIDEMARVQAGDLSGQWSPHSTDEFLDLDKGFNQMLAGLREREQIKDTFGRFVSREVADAILEGRVPLAGEQREVTIFFQDLRGFTTMSERMQPTDLLRVLNRFFTEVVAAIESEGGVVKQFTGDGVMALFGAPVLHADDPARAVRAALGLVERLRSLNARLSAEGTPTLRVGVGIHTGDVVAGRIGPDTRVEYGVVGDPVNMASRIEGLTKEVQATILVSRVTADRLGEEFVFGRTAVLPVKGKQQPVEVVEILGRAEQGAARLVAATGVARA